MQESSVNKNIGCAFKGVEYTRAGSIPITFKELKFSSSGTLLAAKDFFSITILKSAEGCVGIDTGQSIQNANVQDTLFIASTSQDSSWHSREDFTLLSIGAPISTLADRLNIDARALNDALISLQGRIFQDVELRAYCANLWQYAQVSTDNSLAVLAVDQSLLALATMLIVRAKPATQKASTRVKRGMLDKRRMTRVEEYIEASIKETITLAKLADVAALSVGHFTRAFKATKGKSPHQYVLEKRVEKAKELLQQEHLSILEVTGDCGFASQSHMTNVFRNKVGLTPGGYRQMIRESYSIAV